MFMMADPVAFQVSCSAHLIYITLVMNCVNRAVVNDHNTFIFITSAHICLRITTLQTKPSTKIISKFTYLCRHSCLMLIFMSKLIHRFFYVFNSGMIVVEKNSSLSIEY